MKNLILKNRYYLLYLVAIICLFLIMYYIFIKKHETFKNDDTKYLYLIWYNKINGTKSVHGFGDKLRAAIALNQYCKKNDIILKIDASDDICSDMLENLQINNDDKFDKNKNKIIMTTESKHDYNSDFYKKLDDEFSKTNIVNIYTNEYPKDELTDDDKNFAKNICKPKQNLQNKINEKLNTLPKNYGIKHFRFHDGVFNKDIDISDPIFAKSFELLKSNYKNTDILLSNSNNFKKYCKTNLGIKTADNSKIQHIGYSTDKESVENSFIDFFIVCNAKYINTHTCYKWPSNFVLWPSKIYDIPLENTYLLEWDKLYN